DRELEHVLDVTCVDLFAASLASSVVLDQIPTLLELFVKCPDRQGTCYLACSMSAHPVADHEQPQLLIDQEVVFIVVALFPDIGERRKPNLILHLPPGYKTVAISPSCGCAVAIGGTKSRSERRIG